ncbi:MAG: heparinase II/III-family protein [Muribaculaceae bacterium]|nr:heparinase II/III-family protein [Muribaculaceae bacterium]
MTATHRNFLIVLIVLLSTICVKARNISHPSLLFTPERVAAAKRACAGDTVRAQAAQSILAQADALLERNDIMRMEYLALAYQWTGDKKYSEKLRSMLLKIADTPSWANAEMMARDPQWRSELQMAHRSFQIALAYDAIYNDLSAADRRHIAKGVWRLAGEPLLGDWLLEPSRIHSLNSMGHNWWTSCVGMGAILALSISNELPEAAQAAQAAVDALPEWFDFAGDAIQQKPRTFDRAGGMYESINYASFGITEALLLRLAWLNSHPGARLDDISQMYQLADFFSHVCYPRTGQLYSINFGDSHKNVTGESSMLLAYAMGAKDPATLWYAGQITPGQHREGMPVTFPMGLLYTPDLSKAPAEPELPLSKLWSDFGWATMRTSWKPDATMLAVKSGATWNHSHADANSLILFHKGVDIIKDAGNCSYGKPEYRKYFFQSDAHNVVKFNGEGQPAYQQYHGASLPGSLHNMLDGGDVRYIMADGTGPMSHLLSRNQRHYLWIGNTIIVVDDLHSHKPGTWEWLWHPNGDVRKRGGDIEITNGEARATIRPLYPEPLAPSNFVHDYPEMLYWEILEGPKEDLSGNEEYWSLRLPGVTDRVKAATAIILDNPSDVKIERREGKNWIGLRIQQSGKTTDLYINQLADGRLMHLNSWIEADGWATDAYMLAVTTDNATGRRDYAIIHGSSLRRGDDTYFSSLSKLNLLAEGADTPALKLTVNGQPRMRFGFRSSSDKASVNGGKPERLTRRDGLLRITATAD